MFTTYEARAVIIASYILYMIDSLQNKRQKPKGTSKEVINILKKKTQVPKYIDLIKLSNKGWENVVEKNKGKDIGFYIFQAVETLWFNSLKEMEGMFGNMTTEVIGRYILRHTQDGYEKDIIRSTNTFIDELSKETEKVVFEYMKNKRIKK